MRLKFHLNCEGRIGMFQMLFLPLKSISLVFDQTVIAIAFSIKSFFSFVLPSLCGKLSIKRCKPFEESLCMHRELFIKFLRLSFHYLVHLSFDFLYVSFLCAYMYVSLSVYSSICKSVQSSTYPLVCLRLYMYSYVHVLYK